LTVFLELCLSSQSNHSDTHPEQQDSPMSYSSPSYQCTPIKSPAKRSHFLSIRLRSRFISFIIIIIPALIDSGGGSSSARKPVLPRITAGNFRIALVDVERLGNTLKKRQFILLCIFHRSIQVQQTTFLIIAKGRNISTDISQIHLKEILPLITSPIIRKFHLNFKRIPTVSTCHAAQEHPKRTAFAPRIRFLMLFVHTATVTPCLFRQI
jgi:hypothetical protein